MSEGTRARGRLMPAPFAMPCDGGSIPPISTTRGPVGFPGAVVPGRRLISGRRVACPPARRPRRELRSARRLEARPGPAGHAAASNRAELGARVLALASPPPTGTAAAPSGALHTSGALSLTCGRGVVLKLVPAPLSLTVARCRRCVASPDCVCCASLHAGSLISHVIPLRLFQDLNCDRWYFNVSACCCGVGPIELRAIFLGVGLRLHVGVADPLRETGLPVLVRACVGLKPASPLRVRIGWFWRVFRLQWCCRFQRLLFKGKHW